MSAGHTSASSGEGSDAFSPAAAAGNEDPSYSHSFLRLQVGELLDGVLHRILRPPEAVTMILQGLRRRKRRVVVVGWCGAVNAPLPPSDSNSENFRTVCYSVSFDRLSFNRLKLSQSSSRPRG